MGYTSLSLGIYIYLLHGIRLIFDTVIVSKNVMITYKQNINKQNVILLHY